MSAMTLERPAPVTGEWNHSCGPSCPPGCTVNLLEPLRVPVTTGPGDDDDRNPIPATHTG
jgi:hypothetical protein